MLSSLWSLELNWLLFTVAAELNGVLVFNWLVGGDTIGIPSSSPSGTVVFCVAPRSLSFALTSWQSPPG
jgi:hypothetical protein